MLGLNYLLFYFIDNSHSLRFGELRRSRTHSSCLLLTTGLRAPVRVVCLGVYGGLSAEG